jgi:glutamate-ammonia-ligase adenylyltransferase
MLARPDLVSRIQPQRGAKAQLSEWRKRCIQHDLEPVALSADAESFLGSVAVLSPYLRDVILRFPFIVGRLNDHAAEQVFAQLADEMRDTAELPVLSETGLMAKLRQLKTQAHAVIALADLAGALDVAQVTRAVSDLAQAAMFAAMRFLIRDAHRQGKIVLNDPARPEAGCGWFLVAMGKLGAWELNYSSDIDVIGLFDEHIAPLSDPQDGTEVFSRLTRRLIRILQDRTADGYVFRTDFRLRPDPGSTPLALPTDAALNYYESRGQNWERAALIKARVIAGDAEAGSAFMRELQPFIWRKYLDFAAIQDVHSIKRQINAHRGHEAVAVKGHNVKLGRGGIREIEFFVQTQQLIAGGRAPQLRGRGTIEMLEALAAAGWIDAASAQALSECYGFLRSIEHRIQMVRDEQTHTLPEEDDAFAELAALSGYKTAMEFSKAIIDNLHIVEHHYAQLFESAPQLASELGNLVFTGENADPGTVETLAGLGFERPADMIVIVRTWHYGRYAATRSSQARERLTELTPTLLAAIAQSGDADETMIAFDKFMAGLPAGIQFFSILQTNPMMLELLLKILGAAPRLARIITRRPHVFDGLLDPQLFVEIPRRDYLETRLNQFMASATVYEERLDRLRIFVAEQKFLIGMRLLTGAIDGRRAGKALSDLADLALGQALQDVSTEFVRLHGTVPGGQIVILGMGKLGSRELTASSDIDLIVLYDHDEAAEESDGAKPLAPSLYYTRFTQRLIAAISAPTAEGVLYEIDMRLRPSGNKGPVATHIDGFAKYQATEAWGWEHMALSRARIIAGDDPLATRANTIIDGVMADRVDGDQGDIVKQAREMRALIAKEKPARSLWDLKLVEGGIVDIEFMAQIAVLTGRIDGPRPTGTDAVIDAMKPAYLSQDERDEIASAFSLYTTIAQVTRVCLEEEFEPEQASARFTSILLDSVDLPSIDVLQAHLKNTQKSVRTKFERFMRVGWPNLDGTSRAAS